MKEITANPNLRSGLALSRLDSFIQKAESGPRPRPRLLTIKNQPLIDRELEAFVARTERCQWTKAQTLEMILTDIHLICEQSGLDFYEIDGAASYNCLSEMNQTQASERTKTARKSKAA